jgi:hypothetical protein
MDYQTLISMFGLVSYNVINLNIRYDTNQNQGSFKIFAVKPV